MRSMWRSARHLSLLLIACYTLLCAAGCGSGSPSGGGNPPPPVSPTAPTNLTATAANSTQINLSWTASTEMGGAISSYQIARCSGANCSNFAQVGTSATTTLNDTGLAPSTKYTYEVRAVDNSNNLGPYSTSATATTLAAVAPTAPTNLTATAANSTQINLSWTASTEMGGAISSYQIARCSGANCSNFAQVGTSATTTLNDTGLTPSTKYTYEVRGVDNSNNTGPYSASATATTMAAAAALSVLVVGPQNPVISDSAVVQAFTATGHYSDGTTKDLTSSATWTSTNTGVATVDGTGHATSVALPPGQFAGYTSVKAIMSGVTGVSILSVTNHNPATNPGGFAGVFMQHNDIGRTGQNLNETALTKAAVQGATFGKKFSQPVDGFIYAQPLYMPQVTISGVKHNVVYVATENDSVYAFDADSNAGANANPLWKVTLLDAAHGAGTGAKPTDSTMDNACTDLIPTIGVTSTPVIDPSTGTMYVESKTKENINFFHRLHALDITNGAEKVSPPTTITTSGFNSLMHTNRPGLLLLNGVVYVAYASDCDNQPYHGWIFAYDAATLSQKAAFNESPSGSGREGGFWMAGSGIAADSAANIYIASGNGDFDTKNTPAVDLGDSNLKLFFTGSAISLEDYFTPFDQNNLDTNDQDLGSGGVLLLPDQAGAHPQELVQAGKEGTIYVIDRNQMTTGNKHFCSGCASDTQIVQELQGAVAVGGMWSMPAYWNNNVYFWGSGDNLKAYSVTSGTLSLGPTSTGGTFLGFPGATPSVSANGSSGGIVWAIDSTNFGSPKAPLKPAVLHAYDATNVVTELYNSSTAPGGNAVKFTVPTIANGKVYVGTQTELDVYGP